MKKIIYAFLAFVTFSSFSLPLPKQAIGFYKLGTGGTATNSIVPIAKGNTGVVAFQLFAGIDLIEVSSCNGTSISLTPTGAPAGTTLGAVSITNPMTFAVTIPSTATVGSTFTILVDGIYRMPSTTCDLVGLWESVAAHTLTIQVAASLPVELASFNAKLINKDATLLDWTTASEVNASHFNIERSTDGKAFSSIGQVKANNKASTYQYVDNAPFATAYYRLRQIDFDGTETYSKIVSATQKGGKTLTIYPTLVSNGLLTTNAEEGNYVIFNLLGQAVQTGKTPPLGVGGLDVSTLAKGTYILKVGTEQAKFVKQ